MSIYEQTNSLLAELAKIRANLVAWERNQSNVLYLLESRYTLFHLNRLLHNQANPALAKTLQIFLKKRWDAIKGTDIQYCQDLNNPGNLFCIEIAKALGKTQFKPYLPFLMPTLTEIPKEQYLTSPYTEDDLDLKYLMVSDDNKRIIHIIDVLDFAIEDGRLKYNSLFNNKSQDLSVNEQHRLLAKHPTIEQLYKAIQDKLSFALYGETLGAYVKRLITGLREGGVQQRGTEFNAGQDATLAINEFHLFLEQLTPKKRTLLLNSHKFDRFTHIEPTKLTLRQCWKRLARPSDSDGEDTRYCVELVATDMSEILAENPSLYQTMAFDDSETVDLAYFTRLIEQHKHEMNNALLETNAFPYFGIQANDSLSFYLCRKLRTDSSFKLRSREIAYIAGVYYHHLNPITDHNRKMSLACEGILHHSAQNKPEKSLQKACSKLDPEVLLKVRPMLFPEKTTRDTIASSSRFFNPAPRKRDREDSSIKSFQHKNPRHI